MTQFKKPYLLNIAYTVLALLIFLYASTKDLKMLMGVGVISLQLFLLYTKRFQFLKILYVIQISILILGIIGISMVADIEKLGLYVFVAIYAMILNMCVHGALAFCTVLHQRAETTSIEESDIYKKVKILFLIFIILFVTTVISFVMAEIYSKSKSEDVVKSKIGVFESSVKYQLYNCENIINGKEKPLNMIVDKLIISKNKIEIPISYQDSENKNKQINDIITLEETCKIDYSSKFFVCKDVNAEVKRIESKEISFDGEKKFQWKILIKEDLGKFDYEFNSLLKCDAKLVNY